MRRALALTLALLVLAVGGLCAAFTGVNAARDQVAFTATALEGDPTAAAGLTVTAHSTYDHHLFWDAACRVAPELVTETAFRSSEKRQSETWPAAEEGVSLGNYWPIGYGDSLSALDQAFQALSQSAAPGEERSALLCMRDYYTCYPLSISLELPGMYFQWTEDSGQTIPSDQVQLYRTFRDFFRIPVLETETHRITVELRQDGSVGTRSMSYEEGDSFSLWTDSALTGDACYFTFDCHTDRGVPVDTSGIPGGYGIYRLSYVLDDGVAVPDGASLAMVYSLDPDVRLLQLDSDAAGTRLLLFTREGEQYVLTVIDAENLETLQRLPLMSRQADADGCVLYDQGDFLVVMEHGASLMVLTPTSAGTYEVALAAEIRADTELDAHYWSDEELALDYDGRRLAVAGPLLSEDQRNTNCGFWLHVYDAAGLRFRAAYACSLDAGIRRENLSDSCRPLDYSPVTVQWDS